MIEFQTAVGTWADSVFTQSTPQSVCAHLSDEVVELKEAPDDPSEAADCLLLLLHLAHKQGFDLLAEAQRKHEINTQRNWGRPDERGVVKHI